MLFSEGSLHALRDSGGLTQALQVLSEEIGRAHALSRAYRLLLEQPQARNGANSSFQGVERAFENRFTSWRDLTLGQVIARSRLIRSQSRELRAEAAKTAWSHPHCVMF